MHDLKSLNKKYIFTQTLHYNQHVTKGQLLRERQLVLNFPFFQIAYCNKIQRPNLLTNLLSRKEFSFMSFLKAFGQS